MIMVAMNSDLNSKKRNKGNGIRCTESVINQPAKRSNDRKKKGKKENGYVTSGKKPSEKKLKYIERRIEHPTEPKSVSAIEAGYSPKTVPTLIEQGPVFNSLRDRIEAAAKAAGVTIERNLQALGSIAYTDTTANSDRVAAIREVNKMAGWHSPQQIEVNNTHHHISSLVQVLAQNSVDISSLARVSIENMDNEDDGDNTSD